MFWMTITLARLVSLRMLGRGPAFSSVAPHLEGPVLPRKRRFGIAQTCRCKSLLTETYQCHAHTNTHQNGGCFWNQPWSTTRDLGVHFSMQQKTLCRHMTLHQLLIMQNDNCSEVQLTQECIFGKNWIKRGFWTEYGYKDFYLNHL